MVTLKKVNNKNIWHLIQLKVREDQKNFVASNTESILEAYTTITSGGVALPFGIYHDETPIGFVMFGYGEQPDEENPAIAKGNYCIWRFMIDKDYQGKGYAKEALHAALDYIRSFPCGDAEYCWLSYEPENIAAKTLYHRFGFEENGETVGDEIAAVLRINQSALR